MEIQVGEFIRTKLGTIGKIKRIDIDEIDKSLKWYIYDKKDYITGIVEEQAINKPNIISHSFNIIDLIEEGDYVNGKEVSAIIKDKEGNTTDVCYYEEAEEQTYSLGDIKSVLTKEQFKAMEYEVK